jgi:hypothetical protein
MRKGEVITDCEAVFLEGLRNATETLSRHILPVGRDFGSGLPEYQGGVVHSAC